MPVTIKDVAALAGVSPSTVSRTCKDHPSISRQTKEKVRQAMAKLGYEPNFQASSLATQNSRTVGIILPPSEWEAYQNPFYLEMIRGISQYCNQKQYINTVITGQNEDEILQAIKTMARTGLAEGFIVLYSREQDQALAALFAREDRPTAVLVSDDILAVALEKACIGLGLSIPGDVSILSFNNSLLARLTFPPLTSVDVNACQLGIEAAAQMISHVENPELVATKIIVPHHLVERESCAGAGGFCGD